MRMKGRDIKKALTKKGFVLDRDRSTDHECYVITDPDSGKFQMTDFSLGDKGNGTLSDGMVSRISKELKFRSVSDFKRYVDCHTSEDEYRTGQSSSANTKWLSEVGGAPTPFAMPSPSMYRGPRRKFNLPRRRNHQGGFAPRARESSPTRRGI